MLQLADGRYGPWEYVTGAWSKLCDGGDPNSNDHVFYTHPRGSTNCGFQVSHVRIHSRSAGTARFGFGVRLSKDAWKAGQWTHATTTFTDDTADFQSSATNDAPLETTTNGDGYLVAAVTPFNVISINGGIGQAGAPTRIIEYSTSGGAWTQLTVNVLFTTTINGGGVESMVWIQVPTTWVPMVAGHGTDVPVGYYGLRVRATTAPTTAAVASSISVSRCHFINRVVAADGTFEVNLGGIYANLDPHGDAIVCMTSDPSIGHIVGFNVRARG